MALANNGSEAETVEQSSHSEIEQHSAKVLMLGALGVVYGDIGTSPIYAFREALVASSRATSPSAATYSACFRSLSGR
mgnify:CR=1 FL=1